MPNTYPDNWNEIAQACKGAAQWRCVRCGHRHDPKGVLSCDDHCDTTRHLGGPYRPRCLTVHHIDGRKDNCRWRNLAALCQICHLHIQGKVKVERIYLFEHSDWFKPYVAGYYAHLRELPGDRETVFQTLESNPRFLLES